MVYGFRIRILFTLNASYASGKSVLTLLLFSFGLSLFIIILQILFCMKKHQNNYALKFILILVTSLTSIFLVSAFGSWNDSCYSTLSSSFQSISHYHGYGCIVFAWIFTTLILIFYICRPCASSVVNSSVSNE